MKTLLGVLAAVVIGLVLGAREPVLARSYGDFTRRVSPRAQENATEPSVVVDRHDGTIYVAWQASGSHVARSDDGGRTWIQLPLDDSDIGDVHIRIGGPTPCATSTATCLAGSHRVYLVSLSESTAPLQVRLARSDDRGAHWNYNEPAAFDPSFIDRPWMAVDPDNKTADKDKVYISYHDFSASQIDVAASTNGGATFGPSVPVFQNDPNAQVQSFCNTVPSDIELDPRTGEVYVQWITADPVANTSGGCNISQIENFHQVWIAHSMPATGSGILATTVWDNHLVYDGGPNTNTDKIFATLAVDNSGERGVAGNVYSVFSNNLAPSGNRWDIWLTHSKNKGVSWSKPVRVNFGIGTHYFPWVAAGSKGRVRFIWYHTNDYTPTDAEQSRWNVMTSEALNANTNSPTFTQFEVDHAAHVGGICTNGIFCAASGGNRDLADSISIAIDRGGAAALVWTDQQRVLNGPTHIRYACVSAMPPAYAGANTALACKGPAGP